MPLVTRMLRGAGRGALFVPLGVLFLVVLEGFEMVFHASFWSMESLWIGLAALASTAVAGAFVGACFGMLPDYPVLMIPAVPIAGAIGGAVYWLIRKPEIGLLGSSLCGLGVVFVLGIVLALEELGTRSRPPKTPEPVWEPAGPAIECPRCNQMTRNHHFCEICGKDLRTDLPPVVMPDDLHA